MHRTSPATDSAGPLWNDSEAHITADCPPASGPSLDAVLRHRELLRQLTGTHDALLDGLCRGEPRDFARDCARHIEDNVYFLEPMDLTSKVIAAVCMLIGMPEAEAARALDDVIELATSRAILERPVLDAAPRPLFRDLSLRLGVRVEAMPDLVVGLNAYDFDERHPLYHCLVKGLSPERYCELFGDDRAQVTGMLGAIQRHAGEIADALG